MNYNKINKAVGKNRGTKILAWIFLIIDIMAFITISFNCIDWKLKENNYNKQYVYSNYGKLFYENNNEEIYVKTIYDTYGKVIKLDIPNEETAIMYCSKKNKSECIYFDMDDSVDKGMLNPFINVVEILLFALIGLLLLPCIKTKKDDKRKKKALLNSIDIFGAFLFILGGLPLVWQIYSAINYYSFKKASNVTTATIYSEIYSKGNEDNMCRPVSYYYVNDQKYIYENYSCVDGNLKENIGTTFELYYDKNNPSRVMKKEISVNIWIVIVGIGLVAFSTPFLFYKVKI